MSDEIPTVPPGSIATEQEGNDVFLLLHGKRVAKRGRSSTRKAKKWIPIVPWIASIFDETDSSVIIRYTPEIRLAGPKRLNAPRVTHDGGSSRL